MEKDPWDGGGVAPHAEEAEELAKSDGGKDTVTASGSSGTKRL